MGDPDGGAAPLGWGGRSCRRGHTDPHTLRKDGPPPAGPDGSPLPVHPSPWAEEGGPATPAFPPTPTALFRVGALHCPPGPRLGFLSHQTGPNPAPSRGCGRHPTLGGGGDMATSPCPPQVPPHGRLRQGKRDPLHTYTATPLCPAPTCLSFPFSMGSGGCTPPARPQLYGHGVAAHRMRWDWDELGSGCSKIGMHQNRDALNLGYGETGMHRDWDAAKWGCNKTEILQVWDAVKPGFRAIGMRQNQDALNLGCSENGVH